MRPPTSRKLLPAVIACILAAGIYTSVVVVGQGGVQVGTQSQLQALVAAALTSRAYANSTIDFAVAHGLSVGSAGAQLSQGDSLLAVAQADAQPGGDITGGIRSAQAAMQDYTNASITAGAALTDAGLTAYVDYAAAVDAVAEVNATANVVASAGARACASSGTTATGSNAFAQACADLDAQVSAARLHLEQAATILVQSNGQANANASVSQASTLIGMARTEVNAASQSDLAVIAAYSYSMRGSAYVSAVLEPLSAKANATIEAEKSVTANLTAYQTSWTSYTQPQASAIANAGSSALTLENAIAHVNTNGVTSTATAAQSTEAQLYTDLQALLALSAINSLPNVVTDIKASMAAATSYNNALTSVNNWIGSFSQAQISNYGAYLGTWNGDSSSAQTAGGDYLASYQAVAADLSSPALQGISQVQAVLSLPVSQTANAADASIQQASSAMGTVQTDITSMTAAVASAQVSVPVPGGILSNARSVSIEGTAFLNATASASLSQIAASVQMTVQLAESFDTSASALISSTIAGFSQSAGAIGNAGTSLTTQTSASATAVTNAMAYVSSDTRARVSEAASGQAEITQSLQLLTNLNISGGAAALAQASLELQAAASVSA